jgi:multidrug resistance efflux pump
MSVIVIVYGSFIYLVFFRFKLLPWNRTSQFVLMVVGLVMTIGFLIGLQNLTPKSTQAVISGRTVDIAPLVSGVVTKVVVNRNEVVKQGSILFEIDPTLFVSKVKDLTAGLALATRRLDQFRQMAEVDATSLFQIEQTEAEITQLEARLEAAQFNLDNTQVKAPFSGRVPKLFLKPGVVVSPARAVMSFVDTKQLEIYATLPQKALPNIKLGDPVIVSFPALPGRLYRSVVTDIPSAIAEGQFLATAQLESGLQRRMVRVFPVFVALPEDFPPSLRKAGLAANVTVITESAGPIEIYAMAMQWLATSMDALL